MILTSIKKLSNISNLVNSFSSSKQNLLLLRKTRLFVKSRYSRNRQWSKSIVYFGLWFNIVSVIWTVYYCYRYIFIFSHLYWLGAAIIFVFCVRLAKVVTFQKLSVAVSSFSYRF